MCAAAWKLSENAAPLENETEKLKRTVQDEHDASLRPCSRRTALGRFFEERVQGRDEHDSRELEGLSESFQNKTSAPEDWRSGPCMLLEFLFRVAASRPTMLRVVLVLVVTRTRLFFEDEHDSRSFGVRFRVRASGGESGVRNAVRAFRLSRSGVRFGRHTAQRIETPLSPRSVVAFAGFDFEILSVCLDFDRAEGAIAGGI